MVCIFFASHFGIQQSDHPRVPANTRPTWMYLPMNVWSSGSILDIGWSQGLHVNEERDELDGREGIVLNVWKTDLLRRFQEYDLFW